MGYQLGNVDIAELLGCSDDAVGKACISSVLADGNRWIHRFAVALL
jgi:hypothetical protein